MAKKKSVKKKTAKKSSKKTVKKKTSNTQKGTRKKINKKVAKKVHTPPIIKPVKATPKKFNIAFKNLALFLILTLISTALYYATTEGIAYNNLFYILAVLMGIVTLAFILVILVLLFLRIMKK